MSSPHCERAGLPTAELAATLKTSIAKADDELRGLIDRAVTEEESHPEHGTRAQRDRSEALAAYEADIESLRRRVDSVEGAAKQTEADRLGRAALLMHMVRKHYSEAERLYRKAIKADSSHATNLGNYALFLQHTRRQPDRAESYYKRAIKNQPNHPNNLANYASFLKKVRGDYDRAEQYYERAISAAPRHPGNLGNYANFLYRVRQNYTYASYSSSTSGP